MKLYSSVLSPSPRRVRIFLAEKEIEIPIVQLDLARREQFSVDFEALNPFYMAPVLELDDGTCIAESAAICRYFEVLHPEPPLLGRDAKEQALIEMWNRRIELYGYLPVADMFRNSLPYFEDRALPGVAGGVPQLPELVERGRQAFERLLDHVDQRLVNESFIAGEQFTVVDITTLVTIDFAARADYTLPERYTHVRRWYDAVSARPSASA